jgi:5,6-dimethylbenzimidazole synthase
LLDLLRWRRDVRRFRPNPPAPGTIQRLVELACLAPSVGLSQPWRFISVDDPARRAAIRENYRSCNAAALGDYDGSKAALYARLKLAGLDEAPLHMAVFADRATMQGSGLGRRTMPEMAEYSAVLAVHTIWLAARAEGLGMGWVSILDPACIATALDVPAEWRFIGYFCLGYPSAEDDVPALEREGWEKRQPAESFLLQR